MGGSGARPGLGCPLAHCSMGCLAGRWPCESAAGVGRWRHPSDENGSFSGAGNRGSPDQRPGPLACGGGWGAGLGAGLQMLPGPLSSSPTGSRGMKLGSEQPTPLGGAGGGGAAGLSEGRVRWGVAA